MLPYAETSRLRYARSLRCTTSFNYAGNITTCRERPTRNVAIHLNWKLQDRSFGKGYLWPRAAFDDKAEIRTAELNCIKRTLGRGRLSFSWTHQMPRLRASAGVRNMEDSFISALPTPTLFDSRAIQASTRIDSTRTPVPQPQDLPAPYQPT